MRNSEKPKHKNFHHETSYTKGYWSGFQFKGISSEVDWEYRFNAPSQKFSNGDSFYEFFEMLQEKVAVTLKYFLI